MHAAKPPNRPARPGGRPSRWTILQLAFFSCALSLSTISSGAAQSLGRTHELSRQQTVELIAHVLSEIQANFPSATQALSLEQDVVRRQLEISTTKIMDLRDALSDNVHIRVLTFSIDLPSGVSVEFDFPPADQEVR